MRGARTAIRVMIVTLASKTGSVQPRDGRSLCPYTIWSPPCSTRRRECRHSGCTAIRPAGRPTFWRRHAGRLIARHERAAASCISNLQPGDLDSAVAGANALWFQPPIHAIPVWQASTAN
jgi:hypothetical protein